MRSIAGSAGITGFFATIALTHTEIMVILSRSDNARVRQCPRIRRSQILKHRSKHNHYVH